MYTTTIVKNVCDISPFKGHIISIVYGESESIESTFEIEGIPKYTFIKNQQ